MRYISDIKMESGHVDGLMYATLGTSGLVSVSVLDGDKTELFTPETLHNSDCYGVCMSGGVIVRHTLKTATLHRFVDSSWTVGKNPEVNLAECDWVNIRARAYQLTGHKSLAVNTMDEDIRILGRGGSVAVRQSKVLGTRDAMTLYDMLGCLCREFDMNLMSYEKITFYSERLFYESRVGFVHTSESDRYFAKMYVDVCGGGRQGEVCFRSGV